MCTVLLPRSCAVPDTMPFNRIILANSKSVMKGEGTMPNRLDFCMISRQRLADGLRYGRAPRLELAKVQQLTFKQRRLQRLWLMPPRDLEVLLLRCMLLY